MMRTKQGKTSLSRIAGICTVAVQLIMMVLTVIGCSGISAAAEDSTFADAAAGGSGSSYAAYIKKAGELAHPDAEIPIDATKGVPSKEAVCSVGKVDGIQALVWKNENGYVEWQFTVAKAGVYSLDMTYYGIDGTGGNLEFEMMLDGNYPFDEAKQVSFPRLFKDATTKLSQDANGNDMRPDQVEIKQWLTNSFMDCEGLISGNYQFALTAGTHTLRLAAVKEPVAIRSFRFFNEKSLSDYKSYLTEQPKGENTGECLVYEAEQPYTKTSTMLYPTSDRSDSRTTPSSIVSKKLNTIGGVNWVAPDQQITWRINVPKDGYYKIAFRYRQNFLRGLFVTRSVAIDGSIPFEELKNVRFDYGVNWQTKVLGGDAPYRIYLKAGEHTLTMTPTTGEMADLLTEVNTAVYNLNEAYRKIIMVTGTNPDIYRDYYLQESVPGLTKSLQSIKSSLQSVEDKVYKLTKHQGTEAAILARMVDQLDSFLKLPNTIPSRLMTFRDNIVSLSSWVLSICNQSLQLDQFYVCPSDSAFVSTSSTLWQNMVYGFKTFIGSFMVDYETVGASNVKAKQTVKVWISSGRDQAEVLKSIIDSEYTPKSGVGVDLALVQSGLMQAVMAGKAPDVAIMLGHGDPVNYAMRGAVLPLEQFEGFDSLVKEYMPTAMTPYSYNGHYYGLPNTQNFFMMFYRTDIFKELGLTPPNTWDDLLAVSETLQRSNMNIGLPYVSLDAYSVISQGIGGQTIFPTLLLQSGNGLYSKDKKTTALDTPTALAAFKTWCNYYTQYGFPLYKDDFNRFRSGEMPLVISYYTFYNQLDTAAPEIRNLWKMVEIPGTAKKDGTIDRSTAASGTAGVILSTTKKADAAWSFLRWWNTGEVQAEYGRQIENVLGASGRYNPANTTALKYLNWSGKELETITKQWKNVMELPEVPGSYYVSRSIDNAFKEVYYSNENCREALNYWNKQINDELARKREEFQLN